MSTSSANSGDPAPKKNSALKVFLIVGAIFAVTCIGVCGSIFMLAMSGSSGPSASEIAKLPPMHKSLHDLEAAIPTIRSGSSSSITVMSHLHKSYGPHTTGVSSFSVFAELLDDDLREVTVSCEIPKGGDKATVDTAEQNTIAVLKMLDPGFTDDKIQPFLLFGDAESGSQDFGLAHVTIRTAKKADQSATREYIVTMAGATVAAVAQPGGTTADKTVDPSQANPLTFAVTVDQLEAAIPVLKEAGHKTTTADGVTCSAWTDFSLHGQTHTVLAFGDPNHLTSVKVQTHIFDKGEKLDRMSGMIVAWSVLAQLDPNLPASDLEGFTKWSWAALGRETHGKVIVQLRGQGNDALGQKIEYTLTPAK